MGGRLVGREAELDRIAGAVVSARGGTSRCLLVTGEAGIGKSRLVAEAVGSLGDALVLTGHAADMTTGEIPFGVVADTLRDLVRVAGVDVLLPAERDALAPLLPGSAPRQQVERVQLLSTFLDLLERLARERLVVWVVEDLHWADSATRDLVGLAARTLPAGLLIVATVRTDDPERTPAAEAALTSYVAGLARTPGCEVLPLSRLGTDAVQRQLRDLLGSHPSAEVASRVERLSDGIPFVVEELVAAAGRPELTTVAAVAAGRLGGLGPETRRLVEAAAVGDGHLRISLLEQVLDVTPEELDEALLEALRAGILTTDHERDAVGFRHALLREAANRETGPGARRSWHRRWAEVLEDNPGVLAADPALLAIAEHWHQAKDTRRALAATVAAMPAAERICRADEELALWARVMRGYGTMHDAAHVAGLSLREAYARSALTAGVASLAAEREWIGAVPTELLTEPVRRFHALRQIVHGKGEANAYADDELLAISSAVDEEENDLLAVMVRAFTGSNLTQHTQRGDELIARAWTDARRLGDTRVAFMVAAVESYRAQVLGDPEGAATRLREVLEEIGNTTWLGVFHLWGNLAWCEVVCGNQDRADAAVTEGLSRLRRPHLSINVWEHLVENATATWILSGQWARARDLFEESAPWWEDDVRTSNARHDLLDLQQRGTADLERWRVHLGSPAPGGAADCMVRELLGAGAAAQGDLRGMRATLRPRGPGTAHPRRRPAVEHRRPGRTGRGRRRPGGTPRRRARGPGAPVGGRRGCAAVPSLRPARRRLAPRPRRPARPLPGSRRPPGAAGCPRGLGADRARPGRGCHAPVAGGAGGDPRRPRRCPAPPRGRASGRGAAGRRAPAGARRRAGGEVGDRPARTAYGRRADRARGRGAAAGGRGDDQRADRREALHVAQDGERPRLAHPREARGGQPHGGCGDGAPAGVARLTTACRSVPPGCPKHRRRGLAEHCLVT